MRYLVILAFLLTPLYARADAAADLAARLSALKTLKGTFEQTVLDKGGTQLQDANGTMVVARPNRFRWHTKKPFEQLVVSDGKQVWIYDADLEQVVIKPLANQVSKTPALLFGGNPGDIDKSFRVEETDHDGSRVTFSLKPKDKDPMFSVLEVTFDGRRPASMRLEDALGQKTTIDFNDLTINGSIPDDRFRFTPPKGADVIHQKQ